MKSVFSSNPFCPIIDFEWNIVRACMKYSYKSKVDIFRGEQAQVLKKYLRMIWWWCWLRCWVVASECCKSTQSCLLYSCVLYSCHRDISPLLKRKQITAETAHHKSKEESIMMQDAEEEKTRENRIRVKRVHVTVRTIHRSANEMRRNSVILNRVKSSTALRSAGYAPAPGRSECLCINSERLCKWWGGIALSSTASNPQPRWDRQEYRV